MEIKLTDNEIIKALEYCSSSDLGECRNCPFYEQCENDELLVTYTLDLINRQQAEIERLNNLITETNKYRGEVIHAITHIDEVKAEAYKEFAEKVEKLKFPNAHETKGYVIYGEDFDNLLKEMEGRNDD